MVFSARSSLPGLWTISTGGIIIGMQQRQYLWTKYATRCRTIWASNRPHLEVTEWLRGQVCAAPRLVELVAKRIDRLSCESSIRRRCPGMIRTPPTGAPQRHSGWSGASTCTRWARPWAASRECAAAQRTRGGWITIGTAQSLPPYGWQHCGAEFSARLWVLQSFRWKALAA
jgi:hypothetical protein